MNKGTPTINMSMWINIPWRMVSTEVLEFFWTNISEFLLHEHNLLVCQLILKKEKDMAEEDGAETITLRVKDQTGDEMLFKVINCAIWMYQHLLPRLNIYFLLGEKDYKNAEDIWRIFHAKRACLDRASIYFRWRKNSARYLSENAWIGRKRPDRRFVGATRGPLNCMFLYFSLLTLTRCDLVRIILFVHNEVLFCKAAGFIFTPWCRCSHTHLKYRMWLFSATFWPFSGLVQNVPWRSLEQAVRSITSHLSTNRCYMHFLTENVLPRLLP